METQAGIENGEFELSTLSEAISHDPYMEALKKCIDANAFVRNDNPFSRFSISQESLQNIAANEMQATADKRKRALEEADEQEYPENVDYQSETEAGFTRVFSILEAENLISPNLIEGVTRFVGVGNINWVDDQLGSRFGPTHEYHEYLEAQGIESNRYHYVDTRRRDDHFRMEIGGKGIRIYAHRIIKAASQQGIAINPVDALVIDLDAEIAHELAHVIKRVMQDAGIDSYNKAVEHQFILSSETMEDFIMQEADDELFARGFETVVWLNSLQQKLGLSVEDTRLFYEKFNAEKRKAGAAGLALRKYAILKGYTPVEIRHLENSLVVPGEKMYGDLWDPFRSEMLIEYCTPPYSKDQLSLLTG